MLDILKNLDTNGKKEGFEYTIKIKNKKIVKKLTLERNKRKQIQEDESRMYNVNHSWTINSMIPNLISFSMSYLENEYVLKIILK